MTIPDEILRTIEDQFKVRREQAIAAHDMPALAEAYADFTTGTIRIHGLDIGDQQRFLEVLQQALVAQVDRNNALERFNLALDDRSARLEALVREVHTLLGRWIEAREASGG